MEISDRIPNIEQLAANKDIQGLIKALEYSHEPSVQEQAVETLGDIGGPAVEPLIEALKHENKDVRWGAARALGAIGDASAVEPLSETLKDKSGTVRQEAVKALWGIGDASAVKALIKALESEDKNVRLCAAKALGAIGDATAAEPLTGALKDKNTPVRRAAAAALGKIGHPLATEPLVNALKDKDEGVRREAEEALGKIRDMSVDHLITSLKAKDASVRKSAVRALREVGTAAVIEPLSEALKDKDEDVRWEAVLALRCLLYNKETLIGGERAVQSLIEALKDENVHVRSVAAQVLGAIRDAAAAKPLTEALARNKSLEDYRVREDAGKSLVAIGKPAVEPLIEALKDGDADARYAATEALGEIRDARAVGALIEALKDKDGVVRLGAAWALGEIRDATATGPLIEALKDKYKHILKYATPHHERGRYGIVRDRATRALVAIGQPAVELLIEALKDGDADTRCAVVEILGEIGDTRAVEPLIDVSLKDKDETVRSRAVGALRWKMGQPAKESLRLRWSNMSLYERAKCKLLGRWLWIK